MKIICMHGYYQKCFRKVLQDPTSMSTSLKIAEKVGEVDIQKVVNDEEKILKVKVKELKECNSHIAVKFDVLKRRNYVKAYRGKAQGRSVKRIMTFVM